jgi:aryl-alcohol dehydrogenase-like predicted oxidoreductase
VDVLTLGPVQVPPLAVGAMFWGTRVPGAVAHDLLDRAVDRGARFVDTANNYAFWQPGAVGDESETCLGEWIARRGRDRIVLATKIGARPARPGAGTDDALGLSGRAIVEQTEDSLRRLRTDHVDLLYAHIDDRRVPLTETVGALQELVERGWARAIAASNLTADRLAEALRAAADGPRYVALQNRFTFLPPEPGTDFGRQVLLDAAVQETCQTADVAMVAYSTLLEGAYSRPDRALPDAYRRPGSDDALRTLAAVADELGVDPGQAVLAWLAHRPARVIPVVGVSRPEQLDSALAAVTTQVPPALLETLDRARR